MSKSTKYIIAVVVLLGLNLMFFFSGISTHSSKTEKYFLAEDLEGVSRFLFMVDNDTTRIERSEQGWTLNDQYKADEGFVNTLISVLERVEAGRTIENWDREVTGSVEVEFDFNSRYRFQFASNSTKTKSYFITEEGAKEVSVPGYRDNVVDIFTLHPDQWRDRMIFDGSWRTIQNIKVENMRGSNFEISFNDKFFLINGEAPTDSSAVIDYLNQFQQFQANEMISVGRFPDLDSIADTNPFAKVSIDDIKNDEPITFEIYPGKQRQAYHLVKSSDGQRMVIDARRVSEILINPIQSN